MNQHGGGSGGVATTAATLVAAVGLNPFTETAISGKQKRLRHLTTLHAKNLKINSARFSVWFTLHLRPECRAFFVSEKKENERNPKWNLKDAFGKHATKEFILRLWYTNLDLKKTVSTGSSGSSSVNLLNLLLEMHVNMDYLYLLNEQNLNSVTKQVKNYANFLVFEIFGMNYSEFFVLKRRTNTQSVASSSSALSPIAFKAPSSSRAKKSYSLTSMIRIHDYQRVIQDTLVKIAQQKANSLNKFEQLSRVRQMQIKREECKQRMTIYRDTLKNLNQSMYNIQQLNLTLEERNRYLRDQLSSIKKDENRKIKLEQICEHSTRALGLILSQLKLRQYEMVLQISDIFPIEVDSYGGNARIINSSLAISKSSMYYISSPNSLGAGGNVTLAPATKENENSVSLGYIVLCALLLADVFCVPLPYPVLFRGSESYIIEQVDETDSRKLPLYKDKVSDEVFHYAVSLLNADLLQLKAFIDRRFVRQLQTGSQANRDLLVNLKEIFDHFGGMMR